MEMATIVKQQFVVSNREGLHLRPASILAKTADGFDSAITLLCNGAEAEAKSALSMILLGASYGNRVTVIAKGCDAKDAVAAISELFKLKFDLPCGYNTYQKTFLG
jgi:phosphotransferase system HPr (HPr) family protein